MSNISLWCAVHWPALNIINKSIRTKQNNAKSIVLRIFMWFVSYMRWSSIRYDTGGGRCCNWTVYLRRSHVWVMMKWCLMGYWTRYRWYETHWRISDRRRLRYWWHCICRIGSYGLLVRWIESKMNIKRMKSPQQNWNQASINTLK